MQRNNSSSTAAKDVIDPSNYGVDNDSPVPAQKHYRVSVPQSPISLSTVQLQYLRSVIIIIIIIIITIIIMMQNLYSAISVSSMALYREIRYQEIIQIIQIMALPPTLDLLKLLIPSSLED